MSVPGEAMSARNFNSTRCDLWDHRLRDLPGEAKLVYLYLLTSHRSNALGLFVALPEHVAADIGLPVPRATTAMAALVDAALIDYDPASGAAFVRAWYRHNPVHSAKNAAHILGLLRGDEMPPAETSNQHVRASAIATALQQLARFDEVADEVDELQSLLTVADAPSMGHASGIDGASSAAEGHRPLPFPSLL